MKQARRMLSILLTLALLLGTLAVGFSASAAAARTVVRFGSYPQSQVTDNKLIGALAEVEKYWKSFGYFSGTGNWDDGKMASSDYAKYADFTYNNNAYRAIQFMKYRPKMSGGVASATSGNGSGYATEFIYYFKFEPIEWIVLDAAKGLLLSKKVLDSQPYQNLVKKSGDKYYSGSKEANDYSNSSLRTFLNVSFYNAAFSPSQKAEIKKTAYNCAPFGSSGTTSVTDSVTVLSYNDCLNTDYGFTTNIYVDTARIASEVTTYAVSQGISATDGKADWWLRTPDSASGRASCVEETGALSHTASLNLCDKGIRPVISVKAVQENTENSMLMCPHKSGTVDFAAVPAGCESEGNEAYKICKACSAVIEGSNAVIPPTGHVDEVALNGEKGSDGWCDNCGAELMVHLDNSGKLQLDGPMKGIMDLIRKLVQKLEELMGVLSPKKDGKTAETTPPPADTSSDADLSETGKNMDAFANFLGGLINVFKGISDKKSAEKEADRSDFMDFLTNYANDGTGEG